MRRAVVVKKHDFLLSFSEGVLLCPYAWVMRRESVFTMLKKA
jgi:hypothetical protein